MVEKRRRFSEELKREAVRLAFESGRGVRRLRQELGLKARTAKKYKATTDSAHPYPVAPNRLERCFDAPAPDRIWVGNITYLWTRAGWL